MSCFCHRSLHVLRARLPALSASLVAQPPHAQLVVAVSDWLGARALPAAAWQADPAWQSLALPQLKLSADAMATISALAQLRTQAAATAGIDLLSAGGATAFARLVVTTNARVSALAVAAFDASAWLRLAALNGAVEQVHLALQAGLLAPSASVSFAMQNPGGLPMASWRALLAALVRLAPLLAVSAQLGLHMSGEFTATLAANLRVLRGLVLPPVNLSAMASLTAGLSAVARLRASLGIDPLQAGYQEVHAMVSARLSALMPVLTASLRLNLQASDVLADLLARLPPLPYCPTSLATPAVVAAAVSVNAQALASLDWQVPPAASLAAIRVGLPAMAFAAQFRAAFGMDAALAAPCGSGCDAAALMRQESKQGVLF